MFSSPYQFFFVNIQGRQCRRCCVGKKGILIFISFTSVLPWFIGVVESGTEKAGVGDWGELSPPCCHPSLVMEQHRLRLIPLLRGLFSWSSDKPIPEALQAFCSRQTCVPLMFNNPCCPALQAVFIRSNYLRDIPNQPCGWTNRNNTVITNSGPPFGLFFELRTGALTPMVTTYNTSTCIFNMDAFYIFIMSVYIGLPCFEQIH